MLPRTSTPSDPPCIRIALCGVSAIVLFDTVMFRACLTSTATPAILSNVFDEIAAFCICTPPEYAPVLIALRGSSGTPPWWRALYPMSLKVLFLIAMSDALPLPGPSRPPDRMPP